MSGLRSLIQAVEAARPSTSGEAIYERFRNDPEALLIPVVDGDRRPVGLIERNDFVLRMAAEHGRALYARRPISCLISAPPLMIEAADADAGFIDRLLTDRPSDLLRGFVVVEDGLYLGVATALELLRVSNDNNRRSLKALEESAEQLMQAKAQAEEARLFMSTIVENMPAMVFVKHSADQRYMLLNKAGEQILGQQRADVIGRRDDDLFPAEDAAKYAADDAFVIDTGDMRVSEGDHLVRKDGASLILRTKKIAITGPDGQNRYLLGIAEDITQQKKAEARIAHMAHYDALTELPNRVLFRTALQDSLARAKRSQEGVAVLCIDLDHFKTVNDTLGHPVGDALLQSVATRLRACVREGDTIARLGGDEFAVVQSGTGLPVGSSQLAARIVHAMAQPFDVAGHQVVIGASVGIALSPTDSVDPDALLKMADMALYRVKQDGRSGHHFFERSMDEHLQARRALEVDLRRALAAAEFDLHYQPLVSADDGGIVACEALLRWQHPTRGMVSPAEFVPLAEEIGLIVPLGKWVLRQACQEAACWPNDVVVAVNISPVQFRSRDLLSCVMQALSASGLAPHRLELEITESVLLEDNDGNLAVLHELRELGVRIAMDDFGTGYSSLSYLRSFPFDKIKIDQSFVRDLPTEPDALAIIKAVTSISSSLGMLTTAEGVETQEQLDELRRQGCDQIQGYLINRPMKAEAIAQLLGVSRPATGSMGPIADVMARLSTTEPRTPDDIQDARLTA